MHIGANVYQTTARMGGIEGEEGLLDINSYLEAVQTIAGLGYKQVEIMLDPLFIALPEEKLQELVAALNDYQEEAGIAYSVHLPFWWIDAASLDEEMRKTSTGVIKKSIELCRPLKPRHYEMHVSMHSLFRIKESMAAAGVKEQARARVFEAASRSISEIMGDLDDPGQLCVENLIKSELEFNLRLVEKFDVSICYDIGHKYIADREIFGLLEDYGDRIGSIHAHNIKMVHPQGAHPRLWKMDDHFSLAAGPIDYLEVLRVLGEMDYQGSFIVELKYQEDARTSAELLARAGLI